MNHATHTLSRPISYSQLSSCLRCPKAHDYSYRQGLRRKIPSRALQLGSLVDDGLTAAIEALAVEWDGLNSFALASIECEFLNWKEQPGLQAALDLTPGAEDEANQTKQDAIDITEIAIDRLGLAEGRWEILRDKKGTIACQYEVRAPLEHHEPGYIGFIDWCAIDKDTGHRWLIDTKCRASLESEEMMRFDYQLSSYEAAAQHMFAEPFSGVAQWQIKSKVPSAKVLKSGKLSKAANQGCDWPTFRHALLERGGNFRGYEDMEAKLPVYHSMTWTMRSQTELDNTWGMVEEGARVLVEALKSKRPALRVLNSKICSWCDYRDLCLEELKGHSGDVIRERDFTEKTYD